MRTTNAIKRKIHIYLKRKQSKSIYRYSIYGNNKIHNELPQYINEEADTSRALACRERKNKKKKKTRSEVKMTMRGRRI